MKKSIICAACAAALAVTSAQAGDVGVGVDIHIGNRPPAVTVPVPPPPPPAPVVVEEPPEFILPPALGFYVAVGVPYDMFFIDNYYYSFRGGVWYRSPLYNGPWGVVKYKRLPPGLRKYRHEQIVSIRDEEYRHWQHDRDHYRGKYFRPDRHETKHEMKERRKEEKREWKEEKREMKEERKEGKHGRHGEE